MRLALPCLLSLLALVACSRPAEEPAASSPPPVAAAPVPAPQPEPASDTRRQLLSHIWELTSPAGRPPRSIYVFLPDGSLLMTSCVETYRIASWALDQAEQIEIREDAQTRYLATITELTDSTLKLKLNLISEEIELGFRKAEPQTVCPDLRR